MLRPAVLHYHLFKNAGTSLDALLKQRFPGGWLTREFPARPDQNRAQLVEWIESNAQATCFSSHTALLPAPQLHNRSILPVIFVRHPLDRIASAYSFENKQGDANFGSTLARNTDLRGYIETRLAMPRDRQCRNFHVDRFKDAVPAIPGWSELQRALRALEVLPFVGVVEHMDESLRRLSKWLSEHGFPDLDEFTAVRHNVSSGRPQTLSDRLQRLRRELGDEDYTALELANADDLHLYEAASALYNE